MDLGFRQADGTLSTDGFNPYGNGNWQVVFDPKLFAVPTGTFEIYHIALTGPLGSVVQVWIDRRFYEISPHGDINSWDPNQAMHLIGGGQTVYFYWNSGIVPVPMVTVDLRETAILS